MKSKRNFWPLSIYRSGAARALAGVALLLIGCEQKPDSRSAAEPPPAAPAAPAAPVISAPASTAIASEQQWMVHQVVEEIARLAAFAGKLDLSAAPANLTQIRPLAESPQEARYAVEIRLPQREPISLELALRYVWDSRPYTAVARALLTQLQLRPAQPAASPGSALGALANLRAEVLQAENKRLSARLTEQPLDAGAHEQAALILGTLALRENAGAFWDPKDLCSRTITHVAFAQALRGEQAPTATAQVAELLVGLIADTKADCERRIAALTLRTKEQPELKPWLMAAQLRNTRDYRLLGNFAHASLLEKIEFFRAACEAADSSFAWEALTAGNVEPLTDWGRILLQFDFSVGEGHVVGRAALPAEYAELSAIFPEAARAGMSPGALARALNRNSAHCVTKTSTGEMQVEVIDPGLWGGFLQRHLCHSISRIHHFLEEKYGDPAQAAEFRQFANSNFGELTLFPLISVAEKQAEWLQPLRPQVEALIRTHPQLVTDTLWVGYMRQNQMVAPAGAFDVGPWFSGVPVGTAYTFGSRAQHVHAIHNLTPAGLQPYLELAPTSYSVAVKMLMAVSGGKPTAAQCRTVLGRFLDYYTPAMRWYAHSVREEPAEYEKVTRNLAKVDPYQLVALSQYFVKSGRKQEAAETFESAITLGANPIGIANSCGWIVNYYVDTGRTPRALEIAKMAAEVYSASGLLTAGKLMERLGRLPEAETHYRNCDERYREYGSLAGFYFRQSQNGQNFAYEQKYRALEKARFPQGIPVATLAGFREPPARGVLLTENSATLQQAGLQRGEVIVALDGKAVNSVAEYQFVRDLQFYEEMPLIVFNPASKKYRAISPRVPDRKFGVDIQDYRP